MISRRTDERKLIYVRQNTTNNDIDQFTSTENEQKNERKRIHTTDLDCKEEAKKEKRENS